MAAAVARPPTGRTITSSSPWITNVGTRTPAHEAPLKKVLVLCYGVGTTVQAATELDAVESIDVAEISRDVIGMSDVIYRGGSNPLHDPRVRLHVEDGRQFLGISDRKYDLDHRRTAAAADPRRRQHLHA